MSEAEQRVLAALDRIQRNQEQALQRQAEALALQRQQFELVQKQFERNERIQDRAEMIQERSAQLVGVARRITVILLPILLALVAYVSWLIFR
jgi:hypothetical protein